MLLIFRRQSPWGDLGDGELEPQIRQEVQRAGLAESFRFYGYTEPERVRDVMEQCHIHLFTSNHFRRVLRIPHIPDRLVGRASHTPHKENGGASSARNLGIGLATGAYLGFVDSDDYIEPDMYALMMHAMCERKGDIVQISRDEVDL